MKIQQVPAGKYRAIRAGAGRKTSWTVRILPHPDSESKHFDSLRKSLKLSSDSAEVIRRLNPIIRGWTNYFKYSDGCSAEHTVAPQNSVVRSNSLRVYQLLSNWQKRKYHTRKRLEKIWKKVGNNNWVFYSMDKNTGKVYTLVSHGVGVTWSLIEYVPIKSDYSPYNVTWRESKGDKDVLKYWINRLPHYHGLDTRIAKLYKRQNGICQHCKELITFSDLFEVDHIVPRSKSGRETIYNLRLLHKECHLLLSQRK
jgi:hypothetical protein